MEHSAHALSWLVLFIPVLLISLAFSAFWIWMLVDSVTNKGIDSNERLIWVLVIVFTHFIGAAIYFFVGRPKRLQAPLPPMTQ